MATATGTKALCSTCQKAAGILTCRGCGKDFCYRHVAEHRQELNKQMDEVTTTHDQLQQTIIEQEAQPTCHPLMKRIDEWEQQSIDKIHQAAERARQEVLNILGTYRTQVTNDLTHLTTELSKARNEDDYVETDLKEWIEKLDKLRLDLTAAQTIDFGRDDDKTSLISKIFIDDASTDIFHQTTGDIQISEDKRIVVHGPMNEIGVARCKGEYLLGQHRFHFKIGQLSDNKGFSCGIVSKSTPMGSILNIPVHHPIYQCRYNTFRAYDLLNHNVVFTFTEPNYHFQINDTYELLMDCNRQKMGLTNKQSGNTQELNVNLATCPFPWQFFITLHYGNDRVCLC